MPDAKQAFQPKKIHLFIKGYLLFFIFSFPGIISSAQTPAITSFTPLAGPTGTTIIITGTNFNAIPSNNIVYFGAVRAAVSTAAVNSLTVIVPQGANYKPVTVTNVTNGLTAYSAKPFQVTFPGGDNFFTTSSFGNELQAPVGVYPNHVVAGDIDGDGKPDLIAISDPGGSAFTLSYLRNTTTHGTISFAPKIDEILAGYGGNSICLGDLDGDGKLDLVSSCSQKLYVFRNISTPGNILFSPPTIFTNGLLSTTYSVQINDIDKDGKPDIVFTNDGAVCIFKNNSTSGNIALASLVTLVPSASFTIRNEQLKIEDLDGDLKPDIAITYYFVDSLYIMRNTSTPGTISFDAAVKYSTGANSDPAGLCIGDVDGDKLSDISFSSSGTDRLSTYKNTSTPGTISFVPFSNIGNLFTTRDVANGDINGDGKLDFVVNRPTFSTIAIIRNVSTPCKPSFDPFAEYDAAISRDLLLSDLNGDGRPELITALNSLNAIKILRNNIGQSVKGCPGSNLAILSSLTGSSYQWQQNTGSGYLNISNNINLVGTNTSLLQINNVPISWNGYKFRCVVDSDTSNVFSVSVNSSLTLSIDISNCPMLVCSGNANTVFSATEINGGLFPQFQWQDSTNISGWVNISGATTSILNYNTVISGAKVRCLLTSSYSCATPASVVSNTIALTITTTVIPVNTISGNTTVTQGQSTNLTAVAINGGTFPAYQWQDSTNLATWANITNAISASITYAPARTGNKIRCILTSSTNCATPAIVYSNTLTFTVNLVTAVTAVPANSYNIVFFPNPAYSSLYIDSLKLIDKWQTIEISAVNGTKILSLSVKGLTSSRIDISTLPKGIYFAILKRKNGANAYLKFVKQ